MNLADWSELADELAERSRAICSEHGCGLEAHKCGFYAYLTPEGELLEVCLPDDFSGHSEPFAAIALPWDGTGEELRDEVEYQIEEMGV